MPAHGSIWPQAGGRGRSRRMAGRRRAVGAGGTLSCPAALYHLTCIFNRFDTLLDIPTVAREFFLTVWGEWA
jgi:hypothetical protein